MDNQIYDTVIVGSGPAGLTAGIYNVRAALKTVVIAGNQPGGQLTITTLVENFPGFAHGVGGVKLMLETQDQFRNLGGEIQNGVVLNISKGTNPSKSPFNKGDFAVTLQSGKTLTTKAVIVATGAAAKWLGLPGEKELMGRGVSGCATCDGMFYKDKTVAVVGGGDTACEDAFFLTKFAKKVYLIHRRDELRAQVAQKKKVIDNPEIEIIWDTEVTEINYELKITNERLENIKIKNNKNGEERTLEVEGLFMAIGRVPATEMVKDLVELKETGQIVIGKNTDYMMMSSVPGIFAAGDCADAVYRQAIVAAGDGARAGLDAERWIEK